MIHFDTRWRANTLRHTMITLLAALLTALALTGTATANPVPASNASVQDSDSKNSSNPKSTKKAKPKWLKKRYRRAKRQARKCHYLKAFRVISPVRRQVIKHYGVVVGYRHLAAWSYSHGFNGRKKAWRKKGTRLAKKGEKVALRIAGGWSNIDAVIGNHGSEWQDLMTIPLGGYSVPANYPPDHCH